MASAKAGLEAALAGADAGGAAATSPTVKVEGMADGGDSSGIASSNGKRGDVERPLASFV